MRIHLLPLLLPLACNPVGDVYTERRPELQVRLPCEDSGQVCDLIEVLDVAFEREDESTFRIVNPGERALVVELSIDHDDFSVAPDSANVAAAGQADFSVTYAPTVFDDQEAILLVEHNAVSESLELTVLGTTNPDADEDGYKHELAPAGNDCNDFNASVNPGQKEVWYDGIDQDCDEWSDYDKDRDGHDIHTRPDGDDCDDDNPMTHPGAPDPADDGIDQDCDGEDG